MSTKVSGTVLYKQRSSSYKGQEKLLVANMLYTLHTYILKSPLVPEEKKKFYNPKIFPAPFFVLLFSVFLIPSLKEKIKQAILILKVW